MTYDWVIRRMLEDGFAIRRLDALCVRNAIAVVLGR
jgi:hypothetical protein